MMKLLKKNFINIAKAKIKTNNKKNKDLTWQGKNYKGWNCNKKINLENHLKQKNKNKKNEDQIQEMKKLKEDEFENNFQFEIIH